MTRLLFGLVVASVAAPAPAQTPPAPAESPDFRRAVKRVEATRDDLLRAWNHETLQKPNGPRPAGVTADRLKPDALKGAGLGADHERHMYYVSYDSQAELFKTYLAEAERVVREAPRLPEAGLPSMQGFINERLRRLDEAAERVHEELGEVGPRLNTKEPANPGVMLGGATSSYRDGWRSRAGWLRLDLSGGRALYARARGDTFQWHLGKAEMTPADWKALPADAWVSSKDAPPVRPRNPALPADHADNAGSAGTKVWTLHPITREAAGLRLVVPLADPRKPIEEPENDEALRAAVWVDWLTHDAGRITRYKSGRQVMFAADAASIRARCADALAARYETLAAADAPRRKERERVAEMRGKQDEAERAARLARAAERPAMPAAAPPADPEREAAVRIWTDAILRVDLDNPLIAFFEKPIANADVNLGYYERLLNTRVVTTRRDESGQRYVPWSISDGALEAGRLAMNEAIITKLKEVIEARNAALDVYLREVHATAYKLLDEKGRAAVVRYKFADPDALKAALCWKLEPKAVPVHESKSGGFKVVLGGAAKTSDGPVVFDWRGKSVESRRYWASTPAASVHYFDLPDAPTDKELVGLIAPGRAALKETAVGKDGRKAVEYVNIVSPDVDSLLFSRHVCFCVGKRLFDVTITGTSRESVYSGRAEAVLRSFELTK